MKKIFSLVAMMIIALLTVTGCSTPTEKMMSNDVTDSQLVIDTLNNAKEIKLKKAPISFGDSWNVVADGVDIATIKGEVFYLIGDTYSMYSKNGNFVGAEGEKFRIINRKAELYGMNGEGAGAISQEVLSLLYKFILFDDSEKRVGEMNQKFSINFAGDIKTPSNEVAWSFKKDIISWGASLTLTKGIDSEVPAMTAIWMTVIANEISEAANNDTNNSNRNSR